MDSALASFENYLLTQKRVAHNTFWAYKRDLTQIVTFLKTREKTWQTAQLDDFKSFLSYLVSNNSSARTRSRKLSALKAFYAWSEHVFGWANPTIGLVFPKLEKRLPNYLNQEEIEALFKIVDSDTSLVGIRNKMMLYVLYVTGCRISELVSLQHQAIDFSEGFVRITGKGSKERMVPLPVHILPMLRDYITQTVPQLLPSHMAHDNNYLFPIVYGGVIKPISRQSFWLLLRQWCSKAAIKRSISPHTIRHSLATHLLAKGADLRSLQLLLGHETINTVQIYTHVQTEQLRKVYDKKHPRA